MVNKNNSVLLLSICWFVIAAFCSMAFTDGSKLTHTILILLTTFTYALCIISWVKSGCRLISVYSFFIAYSFLCNCAQSFLFVLGVPEDYLTSYWNLPFEGVSYMMRFQLLCIAALNVGTAVAVSNRKRNVSIVQQINWYKHESGEKTAIDKKLFPVFLLFLAGTLFAAIEVAKVRSSMSYYDWMYGGHNDVQNRFYFFYFYAFLGLRYVFRKQHVILIYSSWLFFIGLFMMLGLRTQAIPYITFFLITLPITHSGLFKKKLFPLWILASFVFIIFLGIISSTRVNESVDLSEANTNEGALVSFYVALADVGASAETIGLTMKMCDEGLPHYQSILYSMATVIPQKVLKLPEELFQFPGYEAVRSPGGFMSHKVGLIGFGFSYMAEAYLNYGWLGWIFIFLYGFLIAKMENMAYYDIMRGNYFKVAFLLYLARQVFFARADLCLGEDYIEYMIFLAIIYKLFGSRERLFSINQSKPINTTTSKVLSVTESV